MNLKNKTLALVVASALVMPSALAVEGSDGMHYTSAGEGFYASIRVRFNSGNVDGANAGLENSSSRLGVQGTSEMSHGLEGFYRYETAFDVNDGEPGFGNTRLAYVGLRGGFGSIRVGSDWSDEYNFVYGNTDIANHSGNIGYDDDFAARSSRSIYYKSPDFNGLQVGARFEVDGGSDDVNADADDAIRANNLVIAETPAQAEDSELDAWVLSAKYAFSGFTVAGTYLTRPDYLTAVNMAGVQTGTEDKTAWALGGTYGQDNWGVSAWYGENNASDYGYHHEPAVAAVADDAATVRDETAAAKPAVVKAKQDETVFAISGNVDVGPTGVYVVHETKETLLGLDDAYTIFGVEYNFNSKAKTWIEYVGRDAESNPKAEDFVSIGLRHDF